jgi:hypothetical protein
MIPARLATRVQKREESAKPVGSFVLAFVGMLCATSIGFVSEMRPLAPDLPDRGYDEALVTQAYSVPSVTIPAKGSNGGASIAGGMRCGPTTPAIEAAVACVAASATTGLQPRTIGGDHVE